MSGRKYCANLSAAPGLPSKVPNEATVSTYKTLVVPHEGMVFTRKTLIVPNEGTALIHKNPIMPNEGTALCLLVLGE